MSIKSGDTTIQVQPVKYGRSEHGGSATETHEATDPAQIDAKAAWAESQGLIYTVERTFGKSRIQIEYPYSYVQNRPSNQELVSVWELIPLKVEKSILSPPSPLAQTILASGAPQELSIIKQFIEQDNLQDLIEISGGTVTWTPPADISSNAAQLLLKYYLDGQRTFPFDAPQLKLTKIVNSDYLYAANIPLEPTLYSTPTLILDFNVPTALLVQLPTSDTGTILDYLPGTSIYQTFGYGWLLDAPEVIQIARNKWKIIYSWQYGLWGLDLVNGRL